MSNLYFQVSVALSLSLDDIRSARFTEKNASFADELQIEFSTGVKQVSVESHSAMASRLELLCEVFGGELQHQLAYRCLCFTLNFMLSQSSPSCISK